MDGVIKFFIFILFSEVGHFIFFIMSVGTFDDFFFHILDSYLLLQIIYYYVFICHVLLYYVKPPFSMHGSSYFAKILLVFMFPLFLQMREKIPILTQIYGGCHVNKKNRLNMLTYRDTSRMINQVAQQSFSQEDIYFLFIGPSMTTMMQSQQSSPFSLVAIFSPFIIFNILSLFDINGKWGAPPIIMLLQLSYFLLLIHICLESRTYIISIKQRSKKWFMAFSNSG